MTQPDGFEIRIGNDGDHWFVGVKPPIPKDLMSRLGGDVMRGWAVEHFEPTTVFRKYTNASEEATKDAVHSNQHGLKRALVLSGATVYMRSGKPVDMNGLTSPFDASEASL